MCVCLCVWLKYLWSFFTATTHIAWEMLRCAVNLSRFVSQMMHIRKWMVKIFQEAANNTLLNYSLSRFFLQSTIFRSAFGKKKTHTWVLFTVFPLVHKILCVSCDFFGTTKTLDTFVVWFTLFLTIDLNFLRFYARISDWFSTTITINL